MIHSRPSWTNLFSFIINIIRLAGQNLPENINIHRFIVDNEIPNWLPIIPKYISSKKIDLKYFSLEWIYQDNIPNYLTHNKYILYIHGGAFCLGSSETYKDLLYRIAKKTCCVVLSVNYRKAPEYSYPTPLIDCIIAYLYLLSIVKDSSKIFICGDSAGANLSIYLMSEIIKSNLDKPAGIILISPWVDLTDYGTNTSWELNSKYDYINDQKAYFFASEYIKNTKFNLEDVSPINISKSILKQFPPIMIEFGDCEVLSDQIKIFYKKLLDSGCVVKYNLRKDMIHDFPLFDFTGISQSKKFFNSLNKFIIKLS